MKITDLILTDHNPRQITDERFNKLVKSIQQFPKMMKLRPVIYDPLNMSVLGGNMRLRAILFIIEIGRKKLIEILKELECPENLKYFEPVFDGCIPDEWIKPADELTQEEKERFIITDNLGFGEWDMDILANEFDMDQFKDWGFDDMLPIEFPDDEIPEEDGENEHFTPDWRLTVTCKNEEEFNDLYYELKGKGLVVKVMGKK